MWAKKQNHIFIIFVRETFLCHSEERSDEESRVRNVDVFEILRFALDDNWKEYEEEKVYHRSPRRSR